MALRDQIPTHAAAVTPSDSTEQSGLAIYAGGAGNIILITEGGETVTFNVPAGGTIVQAFTKVKAASSATGMIRQW